MKPLLLLCLPVFLLGSLAAQGSYESLRIKQVSFYGGWDPTEIEAAQGVEIPKKQVKGWQHVEWEIDSIWVGEEEPRRSDRLKENLGWLGLAEEEPQELLHFFEAGNHWYWHIVLQSGKTIPLEMMARWPHWFRNQHKPDVIYVPANLSRQIAYEIRDQLPALETRLFEQIGQRTASNQLPFQAEKAAEYLHAYQEFQAGVPFDAEAFAQLSVEGRNVFVRQWLEIHLFWYNQFWNFPAVRAAVEADIGRSAVWLAQHGHPFEWENISNKIICDLTFFNEYSSSGGFRRLCFDANVDLGLIYDSPNLEEVFTLFNQATKAYVIANRGEAAWQNRWK